MIKVPKKMLDANMPEPTEGRVWLVICQNYWGKGQTLQDALKKTKQASGGVFRPASDKSLVYHVAPDAWVDDMGYICRDGEQESIQVGKFK